MASPRNGGTLTRYFLFRSLDRSPESYRAFAARSAGGGLKNRSMRQAWALMVGFFILIICGFGKDGPGPVIGFVQGFLIGIEHLCDNVLSAGFPDGMGDVLSDLVAVVVNFFEAEGHGHEGKAFTVLTDLQAFHDELVIDDDVGPGLH